jgi:nucleotide-binding universal stress UspA family protein
MLVALDLESQSRAVLSRAAEIAAVTSCTLTVLHVVEAVRNDAAVIDDSFDRNSACDYLLSEARAAVERLVSECTISQGNFDIVVEIGQASTVIPNLAEKLHAALIIIGISNLRSLRERVIGSTADRVIRTSCISVLVIKRSGKAPYRRIVAAIDFSTQAEAAVTAPSALLPHARLKLVHVTDIPLQFQQALLQTGTSEEDLAQYRRARLGHSRERLDRLANRLLKCGNYDVEILEGKPATMLVRLSRSRGVDVIAMGAHGRGVILQFFLGSVAQKLLRDAACDLLISRAPRSAPRR